MDRDFYKAEEDNTSNFAGQIESRISGVKVHNIGKGQLVVMMESGAVATVYPVTSETCDLFAKTANNDDVDLTGIAWQECLNVLRQLSDANDPDNWWQGKYPQGHASASLDETNSTSTDPVSGAFAQKGQRNNRATEQSEREGWQRIGEETERDQSGRKNVSPIGQPEDPLGRLDRVKRTESVGTETPQVPQDLFDYLREMLPIEPEQIQMDNAGIITLNLDTAKIDVVPQGNNVFGVRVFVNGEQVTETDKVATGDLIRLLFSATDKIQTQLALGNDDANSIDDVSPGDAFSVLKELALENGRPGDLLRNKDLFSLRQGLVLNPNTISGRRFFENDFNSGHTADNEVSASLKGSRMHEGKPVSINENRDASRPYANTLGNKKLVYLPHVGATLVDKSQLPPQKKLSWDARHGVVLVDENAPAPDRRNMWKHHWQP